MQRRLNYDQMSLNFFSTPYAEKVKKLKQVKYLMHKFDKTNFNYKIPEFNPLSTFLMYSI